MDEIERIARELCIIAGENPDRRLQEYGRTSHHYPAWENYRSDAKRKLEKEKRQ